MDDLQQLDNNTQDEERYQNFETNHSTYENFRVRVQDVSDGDVLITLGTGGCYSWTVLTREDARKLANAILEVTR